MKDQMFRDFVSTEIRAVNEEERSVVHVISDETVDSYGSIIRVAGWDLGRFERGSLSVLLGHNSRALPIGKPLEIRRITNSKHKRLEAKTRFAGLEQMHEAAETSFRLVRDGFLGTWSVGFRPIKRQKRTDVPEEELKGLWDPFEYLEQELMEYSLVPVPANPNAKDALLQARDAGLDINPLLQWIEQEEELVRFCSERGIVLPGINDRIELDGSYIQAQVVYSDRGAISWSKAHPKGTPKDGKDAEWDAAKEVKAASVDDLKVIAAWVDSENDDKKTAYKFAHHRAAGQHALVFKACVAGVAVLNGGRGGTKIPKADRQGVYNHLAKHYKEFDEEAPKLQKEASLDAAYEILTGSQLFTNEEIAEIMLSLIQDHKPKLEAPKPQKDQDLDTMIAQLETELIAIEETSV